MIWREYSKIPLRFLLAMMRFPMLRLCHICLLSCWQAVLNQWFFIYFCLTDLIFRQHSTVESTPTISHLQSSRFITDMIVSRLLCLQILRLRQWVEEQLLISIVLGEIFCPLRRIPAVFCFIFHHDLYDYPTKYGNMYMYPLKSFGDIRKKQYFYRGTFISLTQQETRLNTCHAVL